MAKIKTETLLLLGAAGVGAYFLFFRRGAGVTGTAGMGGGGGSPIVIDWGSLLGPDKGPENDGTAPDEKTKTTYTAVNPEPRPGVPGSWRGTRYTRSTVPIARGEASYLATRRPYALTTGFISGQTTDITNVLGGRRTTFNQTDWLRRYGTQTLQKGITLTATSGHVPADIIPGKTVPDTLAWRQAAEVTRRQRILDRAQRVPVQTPERGTARLSAGSVVAARTRLSAKERRLMGGTIYPATLIGPVRLTA